MALPPASVPHQTDIAIIGSGPQALTLVTHLLQKRKRMRGSFIVFDPSGSWMYQWQQQFAALEIPHLRSPAVHHPDPNPYALRRLAESRQNELLPPYDLPGTRLFQDFCFDVICRWQLEDKVLQARVRSISPLYHRFRPRFQIGLESGHSVIARQVVLATLDTYPIPVVKGLPVLNTHFCWQDCKLFIMGGLAALQVGPVARNLSGARMASERIVPALTQSSIAASPNRIPESGGARLPRGVLPLRNTY